VGGTTNVYHTRLTDRARATDDALMQGLKSMRAACLAVSLGVGLGCPADGDDDDGASTTGSTDSGGSSGPETGTAPTSTPETDDDASSGSTDGESSAGPGDASTEETGMRACAGFDRDECMAAAECMAIMGSPYVMKGHGTCIGTREFVGCQDAGRCAEVESIACTPETHSPYLFPNACTPNMWELCDPPEGGPFMPC
jgi:hypothetical protein